MRKVVIGLLGIALVACGGDSQETLSTVEKEETQETVAQRPVSSISGAAITIKGTITNAESKQIQFMPVDGKEFFVPISEDGTFSTDLEASQSGAILYLVDGIQGMMWIEPGNEVLLDLDLASKSTILAKVSGNQTNELLTKYNADNKDLLLKIEKDVTALNSQTGERSPEKMKQTQLNLDRSLAIMKNYMLNDTATAFGILQFAYFFPQPGEPLTLYNKENISFLKRVLEQTPERYKEYPIYKLNQDDLARLEASLAQLQKSIAPEISLPGKDGKTRKLSDLRGKYVLLDFWATWCGPCRKENPNVVKAYKKYKSKGFEVFSVSIDDPRQREKWLQVIDSDGMLWENHVLDFQNVAQQQYQVKSIPATYLIDPEGRIVATNLRGAQLELMLDKLLN